MTKETSSGRTLISMFYRYPRLMLGLVLISGLGFLSNSLVVAQTDSPVDQGAEAAPKTIAPAEHTIAPPPAPAPVPEPAIRHKATAPEPIAESAAPAPKPIREPAPYASTKPYVPESESVSSSSKEPSAPTLELAPYAAKKPTAPVTALEDSPPAETVVQQKPVLPPPNLSSPDTSTAARPRKLILNPASTQESPNTPVERTNNYIDSTDYSIGATTRDRAPTTVVLSERSTGCQTVSQNGKLASAVCGVVAPNQQTPSKQTSSPPTVNQLVSIQKTPSRPTLSQLVSAQKTSTPQMLSQLITGQKKATPQMLSQLITAQNTPIVPRASSGTPQELQLTGVPRLPRPPVAAAQPSSPSVLQAGESESRPTQQTPYSEYSPAPIPALPGQSYYSSAVPSTAPMGLDYYNLATRPVGRPNIGKTSFMFPLTVPAAITSMFGWRIHPITGDYRFHAGTDIGAPTGTPVIAAASGQVATANFLGGYGLSVILLHEQGTQQSLYAHLSEIFVQPGQVVEQGTVIGRVGSTGNSTGPHLHFEWRHLTTEGWVAVDAGTHLEYALAQFIRALQIAQAAPQRGT